MRRGIGALAAAAVLAAPCPVLPFEASVSAPRRLPDRVEYTVKFPSPVKSLFPANDTVWGRLFLPALGRGPFPCVLLLPVMAAPNTWIEERFVDGLIRGGLAAFLIETPYQFHRRPGPTLPSGQVFLARTAKRLAFNFRQAVMDSRRALSWLSRAPGVDGSKLGILGVSLGALVGASVYSTDARPRYAVFVLGGADFPDLLLHSSMTAPFVRKLGLTVGEMRRAFKGLDPLEHRGGNLEKPALLINASRDTVIPMADALKLKAAFPAARQMWLPLGHYSSIVHLIWLPRYVARRFFAHLEARGSEKLKVKREKQKVGSKKI